MKLPSASAALEPSELRGFVSRVLDGDAEPDCAERLCAHWRDDPSARAAWHEYHLIGDVMRSQDLCTDPARDAAFLGRLRERLATEAPIVAPNLVTDLRPRAGVTAGRLRSMRWMAPAAVAAGFVVVAGVLIVARTTSGDPAAAPMLASQGATGSTTAPTLRVAAPVAETLTSMEQVDARLIRDARIDSYLQAHRDMRVSPVAASPGGALRNVDVMLAPR